MASATFVKKARKDNPACKKGESYYWWSFRFGGKHYSKTAPKQSQLTQSEFLSGMHSHCERIEAECDSFRSGDLDGDGLAAALNETAEDVRALGEEQLERKDAMPEGLQEGDTGQLLETRYEQCEDISSELEQAASDIESEWEDYSKKFESDADPEELKAKLKKLKAKFDAKGGRDVKLADQIDELEEQIEFDPDSKRDEIVSSAEGINWDFE